MINFYVTLIKVKLIYKCITDGKIINDTLKLI